MSILSRWSSKLAGRIKLRDRARRSVVYWGRRAGSAHGRAMLAEARLRWALRVEQVQAAERVIARHRGVTSVSARGLALVAGFEGFRAKAYRDPVGIWTCGYGETRGVTSATGPWTRAYAGARLRKRLNFDYLYPVLNVCLAVGFHPTQNEADALASFAYNLGPGVIQDPSSTMGSAIRSGDRARIAAAFLPYDKAGGQRLPGLTRRRKAERALFLH